MAVPEPDYSKPLDWIYRELTQAAILHDKSLKVLLVTCTLSRDERLPSWVPNWNGHKTGWMMPLWHFTATKNAAPVFSFSADGCRITVSGVQVDEIDERAELVFKHPQEGPTGVNVAMAVERILISQQWLGLATRKFAEPYRKTGQTVLEAFFRTLIHNGSTATNLKEGPDVEKFRGFFERWHGVFANADSGELQDKYQGKRDNKIFDALGLVETADARFHADMGFLTRSKAFCSTATGYMVLTPESAKAGDLVVLLMGVVLPFVVRREGDVYRLIGPAYGHGIMDGEFFDGRTPTVSDFTFI
jgi:hypothetical protein